MTPKPLASLRLAAAHAQRQLSGPQRAEIAHAVARIRQSRLDDESAYRATARAADAVTRGAFSFAYDWRNGLGKIGHTRDEGTRWPSIAGYEVLPRILRYDPEQPGPSANCIDRSSRWPRTDPGVRELIDVFFRQNDLGEQIRVTIYDGAQFLGIVGFFGGLRRRVEAEQILSFTTLAPAFAEMLWGEAILGRTRDAGVPLDAVVDGLADAAFLANGAGTVLHATPAAREAVPQRVRDALARGPGTDEGLCALRSVARVVAFPLMGQSAFLVRPYDTAGARLTMPPSLDAVATRVARGLDDEAIAADLGLSRKTVRTYLERAYRHAGVHGRAGLIAYMRGRTGHRG